LTPHSHAETPDFTVADAAAGRDHGPRDPSGGPGFGVQVGRDGRHFAEIMVEGISCNGCCRKIEKALSDLDGLTTMNLNYTTHLLSIGWDPHVTSVDRVLKAIESLGFEPLVRPTGQRLSADHGLRRALLVKFGVSAALGMQIMTLSLALYFGDAWGIEPEFERFFEWCAFALTLPILAVGSSVFFAGAVRDLTARRIGMDVTVSLAIVLAFAASVAGLAGLAQHIYFDAVAMFTVFLLGARFIETDQRVRAIDTLERLAFEHPVVAHRLTETGTVEDVRASALGVGDRIVVREGEIVPADGIVRTGTASLDESLLTGESTPVPKGPRDAVIGGTLTLDGVLEVDVARTVDDGTFAMVRRAAETLQAERPPIRAFADRVAAWFLTGILTLAVALTALGLATGDPDWLTKVIAVLIVTCPCALSLATPAALTATAVALSKRGIVVRRFAALERLTAATHVAFDKTGTLTTGALELERVEALRDGLEPAAALDLAAGLEQGTNHPVARAFARAAARPASCTDLEVLPGRGVAGRIGDVDYRLGSLAWLEPGADGHAEPARGMTIVLADSAGPVARFRFSDPLRAEAPDVVARLTREFALTPSIISGDQAPNVEGVAREAGIALTAAGVSPAGKTEALERMLTGGDEKTAPVVVAVGDGVNDAPMFGRADVAVAMGGHAALASEIADMTVVGAHLERLPEVFRIARRMRRVLTQNFVWAIGYNVTAIPAAALGFVPPWLAAIGMTASSVLVTLNAARIR